MPTYTINTDLLPDDLKSSANFAAKSLEDFVVWMDNIRKVFAGADVSKQHNVDQIVIRTKDVLTRIAGNIGGYHKELELAVRQIEKQKLEGIGSRRIHFGSRGDVAIDYGAGLWCGKAIQMKSCFSTSSTDVDNHIKKAALQLTGEKMLAETPFPLDRRIVDITIRNPDNPWPLPDGFLGHPCTVKEVVKRIHKQVTGYVRGKRGYNKWSELTADVGTNVGRGQRGQPITRTHLAMPFGQVMMAIDFVVKIRWDHAREMVTDDGPRAKRVIYLATRTGYMNGELKTEFIHGTFLED